jgi:hypothetical protein
MSAERLGDPAVIEQLPASLQALLTFERFHLHRLHIFQNTSRDPAFDTRYFPQNCAAFRLPCFWIGREHLHVYRNPTGSADELGLHAGPDERGRELFPIHPLSVQHYRQFLSQVQAQEGPCLWAVPTASTRTLLAWPDRQPQRAVFVKTSLHSPVLGDRRMHAHQVGRSIGLSRLVSDCRSSLPGALKFLPESAGFVPRGMLDSGTVIRVIPSEIKAGQVLIAPLFALLGGSGTHVPLLMSFLRRSGVPAVTFVEELLCVPLAKLWLELSMRFGLVIEAHGQDLLLELSPDLSPAGRFYYRDFEGMQVDWELRRRCGCSQPGRLPQEWSWREAYASWGYRHAESVWYKLSTSLFGLLHLVLHETEVSLREWRERGLIDCAPVAEGELTLRFSRQLNAAIEELFGIRAGVHFDIYRSMKRFLLVLLRVRRDIMGPAPRLLP